MRRLVLAALIGAVLGAAVATLVAWRWHAKQVAETERLWRYVRAGDDGDQRLILKLGDQLADVRRRVDALEHR